MSSINCYIEPCAFRDWLYVEKMEDHTGTATWSIPIDSKEDAVKMREVLDRYIKSLEKECEVKMINAKPLKFLDFNMGGDCG